MYATRAKEIFDAEIRELEKLRDTIDTSSLYPACNREGGMVRQPADPFPRLLAGYDCVCMLPSLCSCCRFHALGHMDRGHLAVVAGSLLPPCSSHRAGIPLLVLLLVPYCWYYLRVLLAAGASLEVALAPMVSVGRRDQFRLLPHTSLALQGVC